MLHAYTIREAIADKNVLGFKVDFETTIAEDKMKLEYLPKFYKEKYPNWNELDIERKIANLTDDDMDDITEDEGEVKSNNNNKSKSNNNSKSKSKADNKRKQINNHLQCFRCSRRSF